MNAEKILTLMKNCDKHFYYVKTRKLPTTKSEKHLKKAKKRNFGSVRKIYFKKVKNAVRIVPFHTRSDEFTITMQLKIDIRNYLHIRITNTFVELVVWKVGIIEAIVLYKGKSGLDKEEFFNISLSYYIPELVLSTEISKLRKKLPKKNRTKYFQMQQETLEKN